MGRDRPEVMSLLSRARNEATGRSPAGTEWRTPEGLAEGARVTRWEIT